MESITNKKDKYIYWQKYAKRVYIETEEAFIALYNELTTNAKELTGYKTVPSDWDGYTYSVYDQDGMSVVYVAEYEKYYMFIYDKLERSKKLFRKVFKEMEHITLSNAFNTVSSDLFRNCVPKPIYYMDKQFAYYTLDGVNYIDANSMYSYCAKGRLPDAKTGIRIDGYAKPTEDYPFAFYINSGHCAEYGVFDTHDYMKLDSNMKISLLYVSHNNKTYPKYKNVDDIDEVTILMKPSTVTFDKTIDYIYKLKLSGDADAKLALNRFYGTLHPNPDNKGFATKRGQTLYSYYHIAAIIKGRANQMQLEKKTQIENDGGIVLQMVVDSVIYIGDTCYGDNTKLLGHYDNEFINVRYRSNDKMNRYVLEKDNKFVKICISGYKEKDVVINKIEDVDKYTQDTEYVTERNK